MCFTEKPAPISKIPFPTVTICPETKAHVTKFDVTNAFNYINGQCDDDKIRPDGPPDKPDEPDRPPEKPDRPDKHGRPEGPDKPRPPIKLPNV